MESIFEYASSKIKEYRYKCDPDNTAYWQGYWRGCLDYSKQDQKKGCPSCLQADLEWLIGYKGWKFCPNCGRALVKEDV